jgi:hypothetical protein
VSSLAPGAITVFSTVGELGSCHYGSQFCTQRQRHRKEIRFVQSHFPISFDSLVSAQTRPPISVREMVFSSTKTTTPCFRSSSAQNFELRRDRSSVIRNKRQALCGGFLQASGVFLSEEVSVFRFHHIANYYGSIAPAQTIGDVRRDMLVKKKLEHVSFSSLSRKKIRQPGVTYASAPQNPSNHGNLEIKL